MRRNDRRSRYRAGSNRESTRITPNLKEVSAVRRANAAAQTLLINHEDEILIPDPHDTSYDMAPIADGGRVVPGPTCREEVLVVRSGGRAPNLPPREGPK